ncbi:MAG TPA: putative glycolipid-binding domain-containing protein [Rhodanobacteraceae bacterium]
MSAILWRRLDRPGHEFASLRRNDSNWLLNGVAVFEHDAQPCNLRYAIVCDASFRTVSADVVGCVGSRDVEVTIRVDERTWKMNGETQRGVAGCIDVDLNFSPSTNLLPIRRLNLPVGEQARVRAAWLRFPTFHLEPLEQTYRRVAERQFRYQSASFAADLLVNEDGLPLRYGDIWSADAVI